MLHFFQVQVPNVDHEDGFRQAPRDESILHQHAGMEMVRARIHPQISDPEGAREEPTSHPHIEKKHKIIKS